MPKGQIAWNRGLRKETDSRVSKYSQTLTTISRPQTVETRMKISLGQKGRIKTSKEKENIRLSRIGKSSGMKGKIHPLSRRIKMRNSAILRVSRVKSRLTNTKPEKLMKSFLKELRVEFKHSYPIWNIKHKYCADFFIPILNLVIEVDGKFWHNYPYGNPIDHVRALELRESGYKVVRFWENEFDLEKVRAVVKP